MPNKILEGLVRKSISQLHKDFPRTYGVDSINATVPLTAIAVFLASVNKCHYPLTATAVYLASPRKGLCAMAYEIAPKEYV
jgi:hypothetical protein